jgi:hypothetical protein
VFEVAEDAAVARIGIGATPTDERDGRTGRDGTGRDGTGRDGTGRDGTDGTGRTGPDRTGSRTRAIAPVAPDVVVDVVVDGLPAAVSLGVMLAEVLGRAGARWELCSLTARAV